MSARSLKCSWTTYGILGCLSLIVVEVSWNSDNSLLDFLAKLDLSNFLHLEAVRFAARNGAGHTFVRTMDEISCGEKVLVSFKYWTWTKGLPPWSTTLNGHDSTSFLVCGSSDLRPMSRLFWWAGVFRVMARTHLTSKTVFSGFIAAWFLAASPINRSSSVKETKDGVVKLPCSLATPSC